MIDPKVFKAVRKRLGLSQQELADQLGLSRVTVNKMERGRLKNGIPDEIGARLMALKKRSDARPVEHAAIVEKHVSDVLTRDDHLWDNAEDDQ